MKVRKFKGNQEEVWTCPRCRREYRNRYAFARHIDGTCPYLLTHEQQQARDMVATRRIEAFVSAAAASRDHQNQSGHTDLVTGEQGRRFPEELAELKQRVNALEVQNRPETLTRAKASAYVRMIINDGFNADFMAGIRNALMNRVELAFADKVELDTTDLRARVIACQSSIIGMINSLDLFHETNSFKEKL